MPAKVLRGWWLDPLAVLDLETTGPDPDEARMVQCAFGIVDQHGRLLKGSGQVLVNPGVPIPADAIAIHGITDQQVQRDGRVPKDVLFRLWHRIRGIGERGWPLVIFNVPYDWGVLLAECARHGLAPPPEPNFVDPLVLDRALDKYRKGSRQLAAMCGHYGVALGEAHDAGADAKATAALARAIASTFPRIANLSPTGLTAWQRRAHAEWKTDVNAYWERTGKPQRATEGWPA